MGYSVEQLRAAAERARAAGDTQAADRLDSAAMVEQMAASAARPGGGPGAALFQGATLGIGPRLFPGAREELEAFRRESPGTAMAFEAAGGLGAGGLIGAGVGKLGQMGGMAGRFGRWLSQPRVAPQATLGAAEGATIGAMEEGPSGAATGALAGGIGGGFSPVATRWLTSRLRPGVEAEDMLRAELRETLGREPTAADFENWSRRAEMRPELTFAEIPGGEALPRQAETLWTQGGAPATIIDEAMEARRAGGTDRLLDALAENIGTQETFTAATRRLEDQAKIDARPLYRAAFDAPFEPDEQLLGLLTSPRRQQYVKRGYEAAREQADLREGVILPEFKSVVEDGYEGMTLEAWDQVKRGLDAEYKRLVRTNPSRAADLWDFRKQLVSEIDRLAPDEYRQARAAYAGPKAQEDALELGKKVLREDADFTEDLVRDMSQGEREAFAIGAAQTIRNRLKNVPPEGGMPRFTQLLEDRMRAAFPDPAAFDRFWDAVTEERGMQQFRNLFRGQSRTAARQAGAERQQQLMGAGAGVSQAIQGDILGGARQVAASLRPPRTQMPGHIADPLARMLMSMGPGVRPMLGRLQRLPIMPRLAPMMLTGAGATAAQEARRWLEQ